MIMMVGLPGCGKTTWAIEYCRQHPEKKYNILGTNNIIDKMKVMGLPRKRNYHGRWDVLIDKSTKSLNKMLEMGSKLLRNYILDQTNVYPTARRRKMKPFQGFKRKAVVIVPTEEEYRKRCAKQEKIEGKEVPESAVLEMKAHFTLPEVGQLFDEVEFVELPKEKAEPLVKWYNEEGRKSAGSTQNRFKPNDQSQNQGGPPRNQGGNQWPGDNQSGYHSGRGGMGSGGYRDPAPPAGRGPPPPRGPSGPPHGPPSDWGPQGSPRGPGSRGYDHNNQPPPGRDPYGGHGGSSYEGKYGSQGYGGRDQWDSGYGRPGHMASPPPTMPGGPGPSARSVPSTGAGRGGPAVPPDSKQWNQPAAPRNPGPGGYDSKGYPGAAGDRYSSPREDRWNQRNQDYGSPGYGQQHYEDHGTGPPQRFGEQGGYGSHQQYGDRYNEQKPYSNPVQSGPGNYSQQNYGQSSYGKSNYDQGGYGKSSYESQGYGKPVSNYDQGYGKPGGYDQSYGTGPPYAQDNSRAGPPQNQQWSQGKQWGPPGQNPNNQSQPPYGQYYGQGYGGGSQWK